MIFKDAGQGLSYTFDVWKRRERLAKLQNSKIANHAWSREHSIDFNNASLIDKGSFQVRKTLESWHTMVTPNAVNNGTLGDLRPTLGP